MMRRTWRWLAISAIAVALSVTVAVVGLSSQSKLPVGRPTPTTMLGNPEPLQVRVLHSYYPGSWNTKFWDVGAVLAGCCWSGGIVNAAMHQSGGDLSEGFAGYGYTDPVIHLLPDGSLNPGIVIKFRGYFHAGPATVAVCDSRRCATTDVMVPEAQPAP